MRKVTLKDIAAVEALLATAKTDKVGPELATILADVECSEYDNIEVITDTQRFVKAELREGTVLLKEADTNEWLDIDSLRPQFRWDTVCRLWNEMMENTEEVENL